MTPGLILDMDETLYPERQFARSGFRAVAAEVARRFDVPAAAARRALLRALRAGGRAQAFQSLCLECGVPAAVIPELVAVFRAHAPRLRLPADTRDLLTQARARGWRIGILTNGLPAVQARKARALGLAPLVDAIVYAEEWGTGRGKPEREPFEVVRARLDTRAALTVFVGDDPWRDIYGARAAGLHTILLHRDGARVRASGADRVVASAAGVLAAANALICREVADAA